MSHINTFTKLHSKSGMAMIEFTRRHGIAKAIFDFLARHMKKNNSVMVSNPALAEILGISLSCVNKNIRILKENRMIVSVRTGNANIYHLNKQIVSCVKEGVGTYYELNTKVILSDTELDRNVSRLIIREERNSDEIN